MPHKMRAIGFSTTFGISAVVLKAIFPPCSCHGSFMIRREKRFRDSIREGLVATFRRFFLMGLWSPLLLAGINTVEETALTTGVAAGLRHGTMIELGSSDSRFKAVWYRNRQPQERGLVIFLPEAGQRMDEGMVRGLSHVLPDHGWGVLSLQLPVLGAGAGEEGYLSLVPEAGGRIDAAVKRMKAAGMQNIALLGHGYGSLAALDYLRRHDEKTLRALALLSPWWPESWRKELGNWLATVKVPVLDVYAGRDRSRVLTTAGERHWLLKEREGYRQWRISGTGHHYRGLEESLAKRILGWLRRVAPGMEELR